MAGAFSPAYSGNQFIVYVALDDFTTPGRKKANPTIATGDFQYSMDGAALANVDAQSVSPASSVWVKLTINSGNFVGNWCAIQCIDQTSPPEWADFCFIVPTFLANPNVNVNQWLGGTIPAVNVTGVPKVDVIDWLGSAPDALSSGKIPADLKLWLATAPLALSSQLVQAIVSDYASGKVPLQPTTAGRTLDVSTGGEAGLDWANIGSPTTTVDLSGTTVKNVDNAIANVTTVANLTTNNDKTGYALSSAGVQAIWDALTSALTTVGSIGKLLVDNINATISSRLPTSSYTAPLDAAGTRSAVGLASANLDTQLAAIKTDVDAIPTTPVLTAHFDSVIGTPAGASVSADIAALPTLDQIGDEVWDENLGAHQSNGTTGRALGDINDNVAVIYPNTVTIMNRLGGWVGSTNNTVLGALRAMAGKDWGTPSDLQTGATPFDAATDSLQAIVDSGIGGDVTLAASQPNYAPAKAGDAMTLTGAYDAAKTAAQAGDAMTLTSGERNSVADAILKRDWTAVSGEASRSVLNALRFIRNKFSTTANLGFVTVYKEDDTTEAYTKPIVTDNTAEPIVEG